MPRWRPAPTSSVPRWPGRTGSVPPRPRDGRWSPGSPGSAPIRSGGSGSARRAGQGPRSRAAPLEHAAHELGRPGSPLCSRCAASPTGRARDSPSRGAPASGRTRTARWRPCRMPSTSPWRARRCRPSGPGGGRSSPCSSGPCLIAGLVGVGWLLAAAVLPTFGLPAIEVPKVEGWAVPTLLIIGAVLAGILLGLLGAAPRCAGRRAHAGVRPPPPRRRRGCGGAATGRRPGARRLGPCSRVRRGPRARRLTGAKQSPLVTQLSVTPGVGYVAVMTAVEHLAGQWREWRHARVATLTRPVRMDGTRRAVLAPRG